MTGRKINMPFVELFVADCFNKPLKQVLHNRIPLDLVSCQFALHYCFEDEETAHKTIKNVSDCLRKGGYFIGTVPDANVIIKTLRTKGNLKNGKVGIGNKNFKIEIDNGDSSDNENDSKNGGKIKLAFPPNKKFGLRYKFHLKNSVDKCDEFLVHPETLMRLCDSFGLKCDLFQNFHDFYEETVTMQFEENDWARELFLNKVIENTKKIDKTKMFPSEDWEIAGFYAVFAFRKIDGAESKSDSFNQKFRKVRFLDKSEIK
ncbi:mRNA cap guanine-N7 methyltransferase [Bonamia ostreae]|uniref:mRNA (guanine-N(7))-methyltransferase n=1 Tax=Bonamia ostreae TaxID=126728 RepID=A0ABV2AET2_9EUKA